MHGCDDTGENCCQPCSQIALSQGIFQTEGNKEIHLQSCSIINVLTKERATEMQLSLKYRLHASASSDAFLLIEQLKLWMKGSWLTHTYMHTHTHKKVSHLVPECCGDLDVKT